MLNLFARSIVLDWEKVMLKNIFFALPKEFHRYSEQIDGGLLRSVRFYRDRNYMNFTYHEGMAELFEKKREPYMILKLIRIFDLKLQQFVFIEIHTTHGLIIGYATPTVKKYHLMLRGLMLVYFKKAYQLMQIMMR